MNIFGRSIFHLFHTMLSEAAFLSKIFDLLRILEYLLEYFFSFNYQLEQMENETVQKVHWRKRHTHYLETSMQ